MPRKRKVKAQKLNVIIDGEGIPVEPFQTQLVNAIAKEVTDCENFDPSISWPQHKREGRVDSMWSSLRQIYGLSDDPRTKKWLNRTANARWKDYKSRVLKTTFDNAPTLQAAKERRPDGKISQDVWDRLCDYFASISNAGGEGKMSRKRKVMDQNLEVIIDGDGIPVEPFRTQLVNAITQKVTHCENFDPSISWPEHKREGRVDSMWSSLRQIYGLPDDPRTKKWLNHTANARWKDYISRVLKTTFDNAPTLQAAKGRRPDGKISQDAWDRLCDHFASISDARGEGKSKSEKCRDARNSIAVNHHWGRSSIKGWSYRHLEKFGKRPSIAAVYDKGYRRIDPMELSELSTNEGDNSYQGLSNNPELCQISSDLHRVYNEAIEDGSDEITANTLALQQVMGKNKGLGFGASSSSKTKSRMCNDRDEEIRSLKEELETTKDIMGNKVKNLERTLNSVVAFLKQEGHSFPRVED